jgi:hypothetical protein
LTIIKQFLFIWYLNNAKYEQKLIKILWFYIYYIFRKY